MIAYVGRRLVALLPTVAVPMVLLFLLLRLAPGDPAVTILGDDATAESVRELRGEMGLDRPLPIQFVEWLGRMVRFDFGESIFQGRPVTELVLNAAVVTAQLTVLAMIVALLIGPALGAFSGMTRRWWADRGLVLGSAVGIATPTFWLAILMVLVFAVKLRWFPVAGYSSLGDGLGQFLWFMALPSIALGVLEAATLYRYSRNGVLDARNQLFVTTARAQGISEREIGWSYVYRVTLAPVATVAGLSVASMLGGAVVTENVFSLPGLGALLLTAVERRDYPVIEGCIFFIAVIFVVVNLVVDIVAAVLDPRIRLGKETA